MGIMPTKIELTLEQSQQGVSNDVLDTSSRSGNDAHVDDADIRPIYDEEPKAEVQMTTNNNVSAKGQQHTEQPEFINEGEIVQNAEQCHDTCPLPAKLTDDKTIELSNQLLESENVCLKKTVAQCQKDFAKLEAHCINLELQMENNVLKSGQQSQFLKEKGNEAKVNNDIDEIETIKIELEHSVAKLLAENELLHKEKEHLKQTYKDLFDSIKTTRVQTKNQNDSLMAQLNKKSNENADVLAQIQKKGFAIAALKNELRKLTGNSVNTKFAKPSILGKPVLQPHRNQFVVRQPTAFKSERPKISKERFASQVDVSNDLSKPVTTHYLPKRRESAPAKPHYMIATSSSRYSSNDIVHNHYLEEAKKKTQEHSRNSRNFSDSKHFVCSTCQKCVFNANHDSCVTKFLKEVNSRAKVPSNKTTNRNKPVEQIRVATKPNRQIPTGHRFSIKRTSTVHEKTTSPRSCLRWQPTGRILKTVCLRWVPTRKIFTSSTTKAPFLNVQKTFDRSRSSLGLHGKVTIVSHQFSASYFNNDFLIMNRSELGIQDHSNEPSSSKLVPKVVPLAVKTATSRQELELLFHHHISMLRTTGINPMIQPEPEDLPKDNPKLEIEVLRVILFSIHNDEWKSFQCHHQTALRMSMLVKDIRSQDGKDDKDNDKGSSTYRKARKEQSLQQKNEDKDQEHSSLNDKSNLTDLMKEYGENLDKMKEKGGACIFVGYSTQSRAYKVYNKRTRVIVETIHVKFDELPQMAQENVPQAAEIVTTLNELDLLYSPMFNELLNGTTQVVSKSSAVTTADAPNQHQQQHTTPSTSTTVVADTHSLNIQTTPETTSQAPTQAPTVTDNDNIIQAKTNKEYA
ncbi:hypothetical protein Tco_0349791 [Tanacetum coccineum]